MHLTLPPFTHFIFFSLSHLGKRKITQNLFLLSISYLSISSKHLSKSSHSFKSIDLLTKVCESNFLLSFSSFYWYLIYHEIFYFFLSRLTRSWGHIMGEGCVFFFSITNGLNNNSLSCLDDNKNIWCDQFEELIF